MSWFYMCLYKDIQAINSNSKDLQDLPETYLIYLLLVISLIDVSMTWAIEMLDPNSHYNHPGIGCFWPGINADIVTLALDLSTRNKGSRNIPT